MRSWTTVKISSAVGWSSRDARASRMTRRWTVRGNPWARHTFSNWVSLLVLFTGRVFTASADYGRSRGLSTGPRPDSGQHAGMDARFAWDLAREDLDRALGLGKREVVRVHRRERHALGFDQADRCLVAGARDR